MLKAKPINFSAEMVRKILNWDKTKTIHPMKPYLQRNPIVYTLSYPYRKGDFLWVKEPWWVNRENWVDADTVLYKADFPIDGYSDVSDFEWRSPIYMPRDFARLFLEVTQIWGSQLQNTSENTLYDMGMYQVGDIYEDMHERFKTMWNKKYAKRGLGWDKKPWVWVISFRMVQSPWVKREIKKEVCQ